MAKKKKQQQYAAPVMTRGQLSRAAREKQQETMLFRIIAGVAIIAVLVLAYAVFTTFVAQPNEMLAKVGDKTITRSTYEKLRRYTLYNQMLLAQQLGDQSTSLGIGSATDLAAQLSTVEKDPVDSATVEQLVDDEVMRQAGQSELKVTLSKDEAKAYAVKELIPTATPPATVEPSPTLTNTSGITPTNTLTPTAGPPTSTPTASATLPPVPGASVTAVARYQNVLDSIKQGAKLSEQDYLDVYAGPQALREKITDELAKSVPTTTEAIHAARIVTDTEQGAITLISQLKGGSDFAKLANAQSSEMITKEVKGGQGTGGDLGWVDRDGNLLGLSAAPIDKTVVDAAWALQPGQFTEKPISTTLGSAVVKLIERDTKFKLTQDELNTKKSQAYTDWFNKAKSSAQITYSSLVNRSAAQPTQPAIIPPTLGPATTVPQGGTTTPGAARTPQVATTPATEANPTSGGPSPTANLTPGPKP